MSCPGHAPPRKRPRPGSLPRPSRLPHHALATPASRPLASRLPRGLGEGAQEARGCRRRGGATWAPV
ncbi:hypothetical protein GUJ93_ZPchr0002g23098 [Zizania palustris]|uniref:Uncharacterized protein n=1 Tax=Zizania palustris TaxID=103762 RepID=A0A8J5V3S5_ZIZPA|nr:hypothetical protein GUJ93_ZPchr0002g23098 [Zizania palustris]